jgi:hypothetical protein
LYTIFFPAGLFLLAVIVLWIVFSEGKQLGQVRPVTEAERTAWCSITIPVAGWLVAVLFTHAFLHRYFIGVLPGIAVGFSCMLSRRFASLPRVGVGVLVVLASYGIANQAKLTVSWRTINQHGPTHERTQDLLAMEETFQNRGLHYLVFDEDDYRCIEVQYYSKHPQRYVWWQKQKPRPTKYYHLPIWTLEDIKSHAKEVVFVDLAPQRLKTLQQAGLHPTIQEFNDFFFTVLD